MKTYSITSDLTGGIGFLLLPFIIVILAVELVVFWQVTLFLIGVFLLGYIGVKLIKRA